MWARKEGGDQGVSVCLSLSLCVCVCVDVGVWGDVTWRILDPSKRQKEMSPKKRKERKKSKKPTVRITSHSSE